MSELPEYTAEIFVYPLQKYPNPYYVRLWSAPHRGDVIEICDDGGAFEVTEVIIQTLQVHQKYPMGIKRNFIVNAVEWQSKTGGE